MADVAAGASMTALGDPLRRLVAQPLQLVWTAGRYELRDESGEHLLGGLAATAQSRARADVPSGSWLLSVERDHRRWQIVARAAGSGEPAACYYPGNLPGGRLWVGPGTWGKLRKTLMRYDISWGLTIGREEVLRVWPGPDEYPTHSFDVVIGACSMELPQLPLLLIPLVCWIVLCEDSIFFSLGH